MNRFLTSAFKFSLRIDRWLMTHWRLTAAFLTAIVCRGIAMLLLPDDTWWVFAPALAYFVLVLAFGKTVWRGMQQSDPASPGAGPRGI